MLGDHLPSKGRRYEQLADEIARQIQDNVLRPGDRLPSVRQTCEARQISPATVFQAYYLLESRGLIRSEPRSGYFVNPRSTTRSQEPVLSAPSKGAHRVDITTLVMEGLTLAADREIVPLGTAYPDPALFPLETINRILATSARQHDAWNAVNHLPTGNEKLRREIGKRYLAHGTDIGVNEIVLTNGAMEGLNLCLEAVTKPGDIVVVESPCFYGTLLALERRGVKAIEAPTHPRDGMDLSALANILETQRPQAVWLMTNFQNPLGCSMPRDKKRALVDLITRHQTPLIEDDVFGELHHEGEAPSSAKTFDQSGLVLHCSSFSKTLAPGYRVGWVAAGRFAEEIRRLKFMASMSGSIPVQAALAEYLQSGGYDRHLRHMRTALKAQKEALVDAVNRHFPRGTRLTRPSGGYFVWVDMPWDSTDSLTLRDAALVEKISVAPGPMFSIQGEFRNCLRLNFGHPWAAQMEQAIAAMGEIAGRTPPSTIEAV